MYHRRLNMQETDSEVGEWWEILEAVSILKAGRTKTFLVLSLLAFIFKHMLLNTVS